MEEILAVRGKHKRCQRHANVWALLLQQSLACASMPLQLPQQQQQSTPTPTASHQAAKKRGKDPDTVQANLAQLESILPNLINLHTMKATDW
jgi:hypothetical protein